MPDYTPTDWVDNVTPVNASNMDKLEGGVDVNAAAIDALDVRIDTLEARPVTPAVVNGSWIKGVGGAMVWSTIQASDVGGLTTLLDAKVDDTEKAAVNGVATLNSSSRVVQQHALDRLWAAGQVEGTVPTVRSGVAVWEATVAGSDLSFRDEWDNVTQYKDGDIVVYNGVLYMAVEASEIGTPPENWGV